MPIELIQAIVRQTTVLIAQLATSNGWRALLARLADQVFFTTAAGDQAAIDPPVSRDS